jgi:isopentenyl-diphosphate delta-isomerase
MIDITARAPGKLFIAGEYAVTNPGSPAVLVAVDKYVTVRLSPVPPTADRTGIDTSAGTAAPDPEDRDGRSIRDRRRVGSITSPRYPGRRLRWARARTGSDRHAGDCVVEGQTGVFDFAFSALSWADRYAREILGDPADPPVFDLEITSDLDAPDGTKYGLGSSAAVCVAVVRAVLAFWRRYTDKTYADKTAGTFEPRPESPATDSDTTVLPDSRVVVFKLAAIAHLSIQGNGSLGDVASSSFGGWLLYHSFDRHWLSVRLSTMDELMGDDGNNGSSNKADRHNGHGLADLIAADWPALALEPFDADPHIRLHVGWSGAPASTSELVSQAARPVDPEDYRRFVTASAECAVLVAACLRHGDAEGLSRQIVRNRALLLDLSTMRDVPIETPRLRAGVRVALGLGLAAKTSGAGRGDCLIACGTSDRPLGPGALEAAWTRAAIRPLDVHAAPLSSQDWSSGSLAGMPRDASSSASPIGVSQRRKEAHLRLADHQNIARVRAEAARYAMSAAADRLLTSVTAGFERVRLVRPTLPETNVAQTDIGTDFCGHHVGAPFFIEAMTGGTDHATRLNRTLARVADRHGLALAFGSASLTAKDPSALEGFEQARGLTRFPVIANVNPSTPVDAVRRLVKALSPTALQVHLNAVQELVMEEGDRDWRWKNDLIRLRDSVDVPLIVKEVGFGWDVRSLCWLIDNGFDWVDIGGMGGTNFALIENARRRPADGDYSWLADCGVSTVRSLLNARAAQRSATGKKSATDGKPGRRLSVIASGGVRTPLDVLKALALGARLVGVAGRFLTPVLHDGEDGLDRLVFRWERQLKGLYALYGVQTTQQAHSIGYTVIDEETLI